jgi:hypothetical protein
VYRDIQITYDRNIDARSEEKPAVSWVVQGKTDVQRFNLKKMVPSLVMGFMSVGVVMVFLSRVMGCVMCCVVVGGVSCGVSCVVVAGVCFGVLDEVSSWVFRMLVGQDLIHIRHDILPYS